jgi:outer membrane protein OmpA-like peptidoglycan-associated protein
VTAPTTGAATVPATLPTPVASQAASAPVSLLPASTAEAQAIQEPPAESPVDVPARQTASLQTASLTVGTAVDDVSFIFEAESAELSELAQTELRSLADSLRGSNESRVQVLGFASAEGSSEDMARKLALSRALKVRTFLIDAGVPSARIQVRSLGHKADGGPANRVDIRPIDS